MAEMIASAVGQRVQLPDHLHTIVVIGVAGENHADRQAIEPSRYVGEPVG